MTEKRVRRIEKDLERLNLKELEHINRICDEIWMLKKRRKQKKEK